MWRKFKRMLKRDIVVNVGKIEKYAKEGETVIVPGKVLGDGELRKKVTVVAKGFSKKAREKIEKAGGRVLTFKEVDLKEIKGRVMA